MKKEKKKKIAPNSNWKKKKKKLHWASMQGEKRVRWRRGKKEEIYRPPVTKVSPY